MATPFLVKKNLRHLVKITCIGKGLKPLVKLNKIFQDA
jgi:hypothetical protein